jgi:hypothetical protein
MPSEKITSALSSEKSPNSNVLHRTAFFEKNNLHLSRNQQKKITKLYPNLKGAPPVFHLLDSAGRKGMLPLRILEDTS